MSPTPHLPGRLEGCECGGCRLYRGSEKYRAHCDRQYALALERDPSFDVAAPASSGAVGAASRRIAPCRHLGPVTADRADCTSCRGRVKVKLHECAVHGRCVPERFGKAVGGVQNCRGCQDYAPALTSSFS